jgi:hypothetical protein
MPGVTYFIAEKVDRGSGSLTGNKIYRNKKKHLPVQQVFCLLRVFYTVMGAPIFK